MTNKEALISALQYYIIASAGTPHDTDKKIAGAKRCLEYLESGGAATTEWIQSNYITLPRVIKLRRQSLEHKPCLVIDENELQEIVAEKKQLAGIATLFKDFPELPL